MKALIIIDFQNDFVTGALGTPEARTIIPAIQSLIDEAYTEDHIIIYTRDTHDADYVDTQEGRKLPISHCLYGTDGWNIVPECECKEIPGNLVYHFNKKQFGYDDWEHTEALKAAEEIILCGVCTDICVITNALLLKTYFPETPIKVVASACAGTTPENHAAALQVMQSCQIEIIM